ncbi:MAG TPA: gliding motility-associated C-terminal domain-containing protein [Pedobacter sp.]|nr:gliding motility-associated C-terminal domain-containing protein [Pedobacter sp.]
MTLFFCSSKVLAQVCTGSLGDPVVNIDFGRGSAPFGPSLGIRSYNYVNSTRVNDGDYAIAQSTRSMNRDWYEFRNHTPGDLNGYMMVINADESRGIFYESTIPIDLCPNTTYEFAAWVINMLEYDGLKPNITFVILDMNNNELRRYNTGDIPDRDPNWKQYGFLFETTGAARVKIRMISNVDNPNGDGGNDLAIDDITFRACGPLINTGIGTGFTQMENVCENTNAVFQLSAEVRGSATLRYQWQQETPNGWADIPGAMGLFYDLAISNPAPGDYRYRLTAAEPGNFDSPGCRTVSPVLIFRANLAPFPVALSNGPVCVGDAIILDVADAPGTYEWRKDGGPVFSREKSPVLQGANNTMAGLYTVSINSFGCEVSASINVDIIPPPVPVVDDAEPEICAGDGVRLLASGGTSYSWSPSIGLSSSSIADPIASPTETTLYTVKVYSGSCYRETQVNVIVHNVPKADAGPDKKILNGYSTKLEGQVLGDGISYFWTPAIAIDDVTSLNPTVSPKEDTRYILNVMSSFGCATAVDEVFVKVYPRLIIPNAFSPNGDNYNDVWNITAIDAFETASVKVMNRYGELVFESRGYEKPWEGKRKNENLPTGVYYYLIYLREDIAPLSGSLTLIR